MTTINDDKIRDWKGVLPSITHTKEHQLSIALNTHFLNRKLGLYCKRIECENAPFSDQDIEVYEYDMETLVRGRTIIKIDAENKPNRIFSGKREIRVVLALHPVKFPRTRITTKMCICCTIVTSRNRV